MSRFGLPVKPAFSGYTVAVGYERIIDSFFTYVFSPEGYPIVAADGLDTPITDPAEILDTVKDYVVITGDLCDRLAALKAQAADY